MRARWIATMPGLLALACASKPPLPSAPEPAPLVIEKIGPTDAGVFAEPPKETKQPVAAPDPCENKACLFTDRTTDLAPDGQDLWFLRTFGNQGAIELLKRGRSDKSDVTIAPDIRTNPNNVRDTIFRMSGDKDILALAANDGLAIWDKAKQTMTLVSPQSQSVYYTSIDSEANAIYFMGGDCILKKLAKDAAPNTKPIALAKTGEKFCALPKIAFDDKDVYFSADGTVQAVSKSGGPIRTILPKTNRYVQGLVVDKTHVFVLNSPPNPQTPATSPLGRVQRLEKQPNAQPVVIAQMEPSGNAYLFKGDDRNIYWLESARPNMKLVYMPKPQGATTTLAETEGMGYGLALSDDSIYWVSWRMGAARAFPDVFRMAKPK